MENTLVVQLLGIPAVSALAVAFVNWMQKSKFDRLSRKSERLTKEIQLLYGQLYYLVSNNEKIMQHLRKLDSVYELKYRNVKFSDEEGTQKRVMDDVTEIIEVKNRYAEAIIENNKKMVMLLQENYAYIDNDDADQFQELVLHSIRLEIETSNEGNDHRLLPFPIASNLDSINFYNQEFIDRIRNKFHNKLDQLIGLSK